MSHTTITDWATQQPEHGLPTHVTAGAPKRPFLSRNVRAIVLAVAASGLVMSGAVACAGGESDDAGDQQVATETDAGVMPGAGGDGAEADATDDAAPAERDNTPAQLNTAQTEAQGVASEYLEADIYSRTALIARLVADGYRESDAAAAVDSLNVDWDGQAVAAAETYVAALDFSRTGLIAQLEYDGFETHQAKYGASAVGL